MEPRLALVVEDDTNLWDLFGAALRSAGFTVEALSNGQQAQQRLAEVVPDVVILDLKLPLVSGQALLDYIRQDPRLAGTRVIVTTGDARRAEVSRPQADLVLVKPISFGQLSDLAARLRDGGSLVE